jgi:hypothetical protein
MGDACEMLVAAEMTLAGVPALKMPDNWPGYDVIAQLRDIESPQRISVKSRTFKRGGNTFVEYNVNDQFDWLAIVLLASVDQLNRRIFVVPKSVADVRSRKGNPTSKTANARWWPQDQVARVLGEFENNFALLREGVKSVRT